MDTSRARIAVLKTEARRLAKTIYEIGWPSDAAGREAAYWEGSPFYQHLLAWGKALCEIDAIYCEISAGIMLKEEVPENERVNAAKWRTEIVVIIPQYKWAYFPA